MDRAIYHVLPEGEAFSEFAGGAISRWVANVIRRDPQSLVLCPSADRSWGLPPSQVIEVPRLATYRRIRELAYKVGWPLRRLILARVLEPALRVLRPNDIVWLHNRPDLAAAVSPLVHQAGAKLVLHMHNSFLASASPRQPREIQADRYVFVSRFLENEARAALPQLASTCVLYNGADRRIFFPRVHANDGLEQPPTILFASRLVPDKGAHIFLDAMRALESRGIAARGVIIGASDFGGSRETPYMRQLKQDAPASVVFEPYCAGPALGEVFRTADIFCMPSTWQDPFPLAPLEAMASRLPVVATRSGGIPEAFRDGGALLVARNSVPELAEALEKLILDPLLRRSTAEAGEASYLQNFTWDAVHTAYRAILNAVP